MVTDPSPQVSADQIEEWLDAILFFSEGQIELRATHVDATENTPGTAYSRRYKRSELRHLAREAFHLSGRAEALYFALNPVSEHVERSARDEDIARRCLLLIDCDPTRDAEAKRLAGDGAKLSSSDEEKSHSIQLASDIGDYLRRSAWPAPIRGDSSNGSHLLPAIDLPNDRESRDLIKQVLQALAHRFDTAYATIDTTVYNASRICKLYGTLSRKGTASEERPHRMSHVLEIPPDFGQVVVSREMLEAVAATLPRSVKPIPSPPPPLPINPTTGSQGGKWSTEDRAIAYLTRCPGAISGRKGHNRAFKMACKIGLEFELPPDVTFRLLWDHWNPTCEPPWTEKELRRKVDEAFKNGTHRGRLRKADGAQDVGTRPQPPARALPVEHDAPDVKRPEIVIQTNEVLVNDKAVQALASDPSIFQRACTLVVIRRDRKKNPFVERIEQSPWISSIPRATLRERMSQVARWTRLRPVANSDEPEHVPIHPPDWAVAAVESRGLWPGIRHLESIVEAPVLLSDGSILDTPGHDERSGICYEPNCEFPPILERIDRSDAQRAADELLAVVADFPFASIGDDGGAGHRAAFLASLLTLFARYAINGPCPLFLVVANVSGAGKSKLCDYVSILATGRDAPRTSCPENDEEMRKQILSIAIEGDQLVLIDNVKTGAALGGAALDAVLTATTVKGRILGKSEMTRDIPCYTVWYATGNNLSLKGDLLRRVVPCRLDSKEERPEERKNFRVAGDLLEHVKTNRGRLVVAALTILRGYFLAGRPQADLVAMDYAAWSRVVRQSVFWATGVDPCSTRLELVAEDPETNRLRAIVTGWSELPRGKVGITTADAVKYLKDESDSEQYATVRNAVREWSRDGEIPTPQSIGKRLSAIKDRVINGFAMKSEVYQGTQKWRVVEAQVVQSGGSGGSGGSVFNYSGESPQKEKDVEVSLGQDAASDNIPTTPTTPTERDGDHLQIDDEVMTWIR